MLQLQFKQLQFKHTEETKAATKNYYHNCTGFLVETLIRYCQKYPVFQIQCAKNLVFQLFDLKCRVFRTKSKVFDRNTRFFIEIQGLPFEILSFSLDILGISKICGNRIPYLRRQIFP